MHINLRGQYYHGMAVFGGLTGTGPEMWLTGVSVILLECALGLQSTQATIGIRCAHTSPSGGVYLTRCHLHSGLLHVLLQADLEEPSCGSAQKGTYVVVSTGHNCSCEPWSTEHR